LSGSAVWCLQKRLNDHRYLGVCPGNRKTFMKAIHIQPQAFSEIADHYQGPLHGI